MSCTFERTFFQPFDHTFNPNCASEYNRSTGTCNSVTDTTYRVCSNGFFDASEARDVDDDVGCADFGDKSGDIIIIIIITEDMTYQ